MLPACYDEFKSNKMYSCIEHPAPQGERVYLAVPFEDKDDVKSLGARWGLGQDVNETSMCIADVAYTQQQARALHEWARRVKSWWYWSGAAVRDGLPTEERLRAVEAAHSRTAFARWQVDGAAMVRVWVEDASSRYILFNNPRNATSL